MSMYDTVQFRGDEFRTHTFDCVGADYKIDDGMLISHCFVVPYDEENHINNAVDGFRLVDYTGILKLRSRREIVKLHLENGFVIDTIIVGVCVATNEI